MTRHFLAMLSVAHDAPKAGVELWVFDLLAMEARAVEPDASERLLALRAVFGLACVFHRLDDLKAAVLFAVVFVNHPHASDCW